MHLIGRRNFVAGLGLGVGASLLRPFARGLIRQAQGATPTKRFIVVHSGNGLIEELYTHTAPTPDNFTPREVFTPLATYKKDLLILERFYNPSGVNLHGNYGETLTVGGGISFDRFLAGKMGSTDALSSLNLGIWCEGSARHLSFDGKGKEYPCEWNPLRAFDVVFGSRAGGATTGPPMADLSSQRRRGLIGFLQNDIKRMSGRLASPEKAKLEQYADSLRLLEGRMDTLKQNRADCSKVSPPAAKAATEDFKNGDVDDSVLQAHVDIIVNAMVCNLTHVAALSIYGGHEAHIKYPWLNDTEGHHEQAHQAQNNGMDSTGMAMIIKIMTYQMSLVAELWKRLKEVPEGNATMADNTVLMYINSGGGRHHGGDGKHAVVLLGSGGGALKTGRYLQYKAGDHAISDVFVSVANALDVPTSTFGDPMVCKGPLPGLT